jgi:protein tyrosine phosphatase (PTP) superfamily phosphohydrolase (DUF442 family)
MKRYSSIKFRFVLGTTLALVGLSASAIAQDYVFPDFTPGNIKAITDGVVNRAVLNSVLEGQTSSERPSSSSPRRSSNRPRTPQSTQGTSQSTQTKPASASLSFRPDPSVSRQVQDALIASIRQQLPTGADQFAAVISSGQLMNLYAQSAAKYGLKSNDVADAMTSYLLVQWIIVNDVRTDPSRASAQGVRSQVVAILKNSPQLRSEQMRQMVAENLIYQAVFLDSFRDVSVASGNPAQIQQLAQATNQSSMGQFGIDFRKLELTNEGFRQRK